MDDCDDDDDGDDDDGVDNYVVGITSTSDMLLNRSSPINAPVLVKVRVCIDTSLSCMSRSS